MKSKLQEKLAIFGSYSFLLGLLIRTPLVFTAGGAEFQKYFIPFLDQFVQNPTTNPWSSFSPEFFPYGLFPLLALGIPKLLAFLTFGNITLGASVFNFALIKSVLLFFDILIFWLLSRLAPFNANRLSWFYWLNPMVIYITLGLGHFDVISMSLLIGSLFLIGKSHLKTAGLIAGLALSSKFQVAIVMPFVAAYFWNNNYRRQALIKMSEYFIPLILTAFIGFLPLLESNHLTYSTFSSPEALRLFSARINMGPQIDFIIGVALVLLALGRLVFSTRISLKGLIYGSGFLLGGLVLTTDAQPSWYLWILPFFSLFFTTHVTAPWILFIGMGVVYFLHFLGLDFFQPTFQSITSTSLHISVLVQLMMLYWLVLRDESQLKNRLRPLMLGLSGDSGAGKNYLSETLQNILDSKNCIIIEGDNYHKWERGDKNWQTLTHLNPSANHLLKMQDHASQIAKGLPILSPYYDHNTGRFVEQPPTNPTKTIIFQGLHTLYLKTLREVLDLKIYLDPNEKVRTFWKIQRDVFERGHTLQKVLDSLEIRKKDSQLYIQPQREKSDWVIELNCDEDFNPLTISKDSQLQLYIKYTLFNDEPIGELIDELTSLGVSTVIDFLPTDLDRLTVTIKGTLPSNIIETLAIKLFPQMRHLTRATNPPQFSGGLNGIHQLFFLALLSKRMRTQ